MDCELCGGLVGNMLENLWKYGDPYLHFFIDTGGCPHCWGETIYIRKEKNAPTQGLPPI